MSIAFFRLLGRLALTVTTDGNSDPWETGDPRQAIRGAAGSDV